MPRQINFFHDHGVAVFVVLFLFACDSTLYPADTHTKRPPSTDAGQMALTAEETSPGASLAAGDSFDVSVRLWSFEFDGTARILAVETDGRFTAQVALSGLVVEPTVTGEINGSEIMLDDFHVEHSLGSGTITDWRAMMNAEGTSAEGTFELVVEESRAYPDAIGWTLLGTVILTQPLGGADGDDISDYLETGAQYVFEVGIAGFNFSGAGTLMNYSTGTGVFSVRFTMEEVDEEVLVSGHVAGETISINPFRIETLLATGNVSGMTATFDPVDGRFKGHFRFRLEESPAFEAYEGMTLSGSVTIGLE